MTRRRQRGFGGATHWRRQGFVDESCVRTGQPHAKVKQIGDALEKMHARLASDIGEARRIRSLGPTRVTAGLRRQGSLVYTCGQAVRNVPRSNYVMDGLGKYRLGDMSVLETKWLKFNIRFQDYRQQSCEQAPLHQRVTLTRRCRLELAFIWIVNVMWALGQHKPCNLQRAQNSECRAEDSALRAHLGSPIKVVALKSDGREIGATGSVDHSSLPISVTVTVAVGDGDRWGGRLSRERVPPVTFARYDLVDIDEDADFVYPRPPSIRSTFVDGRRGSLSVTIPGAVQGSDADSTRSQEVEKTQLSFFLKSKPLSRANWLSAVA
ncbi:hypothetical protein HD554DRAFT_2042132 [Boletus coccyginus]|nr:hypothetical protein HD554DRAFT_2042132 [Boletus coccyginus]